MVHVCVCVSVQLQGTLLTIRSPSLLSCKCSVTRFTIETKYLDSILIRSLTALPCPALPCPALHCTVVRWYLGIQSKKDPAHVMTEVYKAMLALR
jgi:hypothetical protein